MNVMYKPCISGFINFAKKYVFPNFFFMIFSLKKYVCLSCTILILLLNGCSKEEQPVLVEHPVLTSQSNESTSVVGEDCNGVVEGFKEGYNIDPNASVAQKLWTGVSCAFVRGVEKSCKAGKENRMRKKQESQNVSVTTVMSTEAGNASNPYDSIGLVHYLVLDTLYAMDSLWYDEGQFNQTVFYNLTTAFLGVFYPAYTNINQNYTLQMYLASNNPVVMFPANLTGYISNESLRNVLINYKNAFEAEDDFETFYTYSVSIENQVVNSSYDIVDKRNALAFMATMRYGFWYWGTLYEVEEISGEEE